MISRMHVLGFFLAFGLLALVPTESLGRGFGARPSPIAAARHMVLRPAHHAEHFFRHRRFIGSGLAGVVPYAYGPSDYGFPYYQPPYAEPEVLTALPARLGQAEAHQPGCRSYPTTVPSEEGGTRQINVVRC